MIGGGGGGDLLSIRKCCQGRLGSLPKRVLIKGQRLLCLKCSYVGGWQQV